MNQLPKGIKLVSGSLALLYHYLRMRFSWAFFRGSRAPALIGDEVCPSVHPSTCQFPLWAIQPGLRPSQPGLRPIQPGLKPTQPASQVSGFRYGWLGLRPGWLGFRPGWMAQRGERTYVRTNKPTDGKSPHSTGLCPLSGLLPCFPKEVLGQ